MRNILFLINKPSLGGAERAFVNQANCLYEKGGNVYFGSLRGSFQRKNFFKDLKIKQDSLIVFGFKDVFDLGGYLKLKNFVRENKIEIIYSTLESSNIVSRLSKILMPSVKVVIRESGMADRKKWRFKIFDWMLNFLADRIVAVSYGVKKSLEAYQKIHAKKIFVLENAVNVPSLEETNYYSKRIVASTGEFVILNIGWMNDTNKGQFELINVLGKIIKKDVEKIFKLILVGDGVLRPNLEKLAKDRNLSKNVLFAGKVSFEETCRYYQTADLFVLNSKSEGSSNALLEAMVYGLPVISTKVGSAPDLISDGVSGILIDPDNSSQLEAAILRLAKDAGLREEIGPRARETVEKKYSLDNFADKLIKVLGL